MVLGNGNPLQYSCLKNPMDGGAWWAAVHGVLFRAAEQIAAAREARARGGVGRGARALCPWNSPGKNTGVGCHALL